MFYRFLFLLSIQSFKVLHNKIFVLVFSLISNSFICFILSLAVDLDGLEPIDIQYLIIFLVPFHRLYLYLSIS